MYHQPRVAPRCHIAARETGQGELTSGLREILLRGYSKSSHVWAWLEARCGGNHLAWIAEIQRALNGGLLPMGYYALAKQVAARASLLAKSLSGMIAR